MKTKLFSLIAFFVIIYLIPISFFAQSVSHDVLYPIEFHETLPLIDIVKDRPFVERKVINELDVTESPDRGHRTPQTFIYSVADGPEYGEDPSVRQTEMGKRFIDPSKAVIQNWAGQVASGFRPYDPTGAAGPNNYVQAINGTPFRVYNKTGTALLTANIGSLWSPATANDGDPIIMYDKYADRWFVSQFGSAGNTNYMYIAISKTSDPTGAYYAYTYTSPQFPDYLKFSIWENGYYMTSNQTTDKVFCFERTQMLAGNPSARSISANFTTGSTGAFFVPLPADAADGGLPAAGTPLPFFAYYDNGWGGGTDGVKIWNMTVSWAATASATISASTQINTAAFDATYDANWDDVTQPGTTQKLDGIGGIPTYRAQWRPWAGYNSLLLNWGVKISATQRSIRWVELRQNQSTGAWSLYQEGTYTPDAHTRWLGSIAMDNNGSIGLAYCKSSSTIYPTLCYTGRLASDPLGTMSFAETVATAGTSSQTSGNRFGDYSHTSLDPDGITFWHTGEYIAAGVKTRVFSFQLLVANPIASVAIALTAGTNPCCAGTSVTFTATPTNGGSNPSYQWKVDGTNAGTNSATFTTTTLTNGQAITCVMTSNLGGVTGSPATSNSITMTINALPATPTASSNSPLCAGATINLTTPFVSGATYSWSGPNSFTSTLQNPTIASSTTAMSGAYSVSITQSGCTSNAGTTSVTVNAGPATPTATSNSPICESATINLSTPTVSGATYSWTGPNGFTSSIRNPTIGAATSAMAGTYSVNITQGGCPSLNGTTVVVVNTNPVVDFSANPTITNCSGLVQFNDNTTGNPSSWSWNFGDGQTSTSQNPSNTYLNGGTYSVTLTATNSCGTNQLTKSNYITINVPSAPTATGDSRCGTGTVNLSATGGSGTLHWFDAPTAGTDLGTGVTFTTPSISTTTTYYVEDHVLQPSQNVGPLSNFAAGAYSNTAYTLNFDCISACTLVSVAVDKQAAGNITIQLQNSASTVLQTGTFAVPAGASRVTLNWALTPATGLKLVGPAGLSLWRVNSAGTYPYTLAGLVSITSCSSGTRYGSFYDWEIKEADCVSSRVSSVATVNPAATPSVSISASATNICIGDNVTFTATPTNGGTPIYQWKLNGANVGSNNAIYSNNALANGDIVTCDMTSSLTCVTSSTVTSNAVTISVTLPAAPSVSIAASATTICSGTSVTFTATPTNGGTPSYQWILNGTNVGTNNATYTNAALVNNDVVLCVMTSSLSCATTPDATSNSVTITVSASVTPTVVIAASSTTICSGISVTFTATPTNGGTPTYQWKLNGANVGTNSATYTNSTLANGDVISCVMTSSISCTTSPTAISNSVTMTVSASATPLISIIADITTMCSPTPVNFTATPTNGGTPTYQWLLNGTNVGTNNATYTNGALANGDVITCDMTSSLACVTTSTATSNVVTITVNSPVAPTTTDNSRCGTGTVNLTATGSGVLHWFDFATGGTDLGTGTTFTTPSIASSTTYYVEDHILNPSQYVGPLSNFAAGQYSNTSYTLNFDCISACNLVSVAVDKQAAGNILIQLTTSSGTVLQSGTFAVPAGASRVTLNWALTPATGLKLVGPATASLWRVNSTGAYPYTLAGLVSITSCSSGTRYGSFYDWEIKEADCISSRTSVVATVEPSVNPAVSISATATTICSGTSVTLTATPTNGGTPIYQWLLNGSNVGSNSDTYTTSTLSDGDIITCDMTSSLACVSSATVTSNAITMALSLTVTPSITIAESASTICSGSSVTFTATHVNGGTPSYQWLLNGTNVGTNSDTYSNTTLNDGDVVSCEMTSSLACASIPTVTSNTVTISVSSVVTPAVSISASSTAICSGTSVTFTASPVNEGTPNYQWLLNGANIGTNSDTYTNSTLVDGDIVSCNLTSSLVCVTSSTVSSNDISISVTANAVPSVSISASSTSICSGNSVTFTATPTDGGTAVYQWLLNGVNVGTNSDTYSNATLSDADVISCEMTSSLACVSSSTVSSNSIVISVSSNASPAISISASATSICSGNSVTFTANETDGGSPTYQWLLNGSNVGSNSDTYTNAGLTDGDIVSCDMTSSLSCASIPNATSNSIAISVNANVFPSITIASSATTICSGNSVTFNATATDGGTPIYQWLLNGANIGTNSDTYTNSTLVDGDIVSCNLTSSLVCVTSSTVSSNDISISVTSNVAPSVSISASTTSICSGNSVIFTATPTDGGIAVYQWLLNGVNVGTNSDTYSNATLNDADVISCEMTSSLACVSSSTAASNSIVISVSSNASPAISISASETSICSGNSVTFTANETDGGSPTYQWLLNGSNVGSSSDTYSNATLNDGDVVSCDMTSSLSCASNPNVTSNSIAITVNANVFPSITIASSATTICSGNSVTFNATATDGGTPIYQWLLNGANVGTNSDIFTSSSLSDGDIVTCDMTSSLACATSSTVTSNAVVMSVGTSVTPTLSISASATSICSGNTVIYTATSTNGGTAIYQWLLNGANVGSNSDTYFNNALINGDVVSCEMTSSLACATVSTVSSNSETISVGTTVTPDIAIAASSTDICEGSSVTFIAAPTNGGTPTYQWLLNGSNVGNNSALYTTSTLANGDVVSCEMTTSLTCATSSIVTSNSISINVNTIISIYVTVEADATTICEGNSVTFTATAINGGSPIFNWFLNGSNVGTNNSVYTNATLANGDIISCEMTTSLSCVTEQTATSNDVIITVNAVESYTITQADPLISVTNLAGATYQWINCDNGNQTITGEIETSYTATANGNYAVIINQNGCTSASTCVFVVATSVIETSLNQDINIYPNPTNGIINIYFGEELINANISIENTVGQKIYEANDNHSKASMKAVDFSKYSEGIYFININNKDLNVKYKIIYNKN